MTDPESLLTDRFVGHPRDCHGVIGSKILLVAVSVVVAGWSTFYAFLNTAIPDRMGRFGPAKAERILPPFAYRYQALVGAGYAVRGDHAAAKRVLARTQNGYRDITLINNRAYTFARLGEWEAARDVYWEWTRTGLDYSNAVNNLSIAYEQTKQYAEASHTLSHKIALWPGPLMEDIKRLAVLQLKEGKPEKTLMTLRDYESRWRHTAPSAAAEFENLAGAACLTLGDTDQASQHFRSALKLNPSLESARRNLQGTERPNVP